MTILDILRTNQTEIETIVNDIEKYYLSFPIKKSSGKLRWLDAPQEPLKTIQATILKELIYKFKPHPNAMGFCVGKSVKTGALKHLGNKTALCVDISNFFPSIKQLKVYKVFDYILRHYEKAYKLTYTTDLDRQTVLRYLVELTTYKDSLPQGAPTSPGIANIFCLSLDKLLTEHASKNDLIYTRYADDLTFSHKEKTHDIKIILDDVSKILEIYDLKLNKKKTRVLRPHRRMLITGVVINDKLGVAKYKWRNLRARLHNIKMLGKGIDQKEFLELRGQIEWIHQLNQKRGKQLLQALGELTLNP